MTQQALHLPPAAPQAGGQGPADVLESMSDAVFVLDREWRFIYLNPAGQALLGVGRDPLLGQGLWGLFPFWAGTPFETECRRAVAGQAAIEFEAFYPPLNAWFNVRAYPTRGGLSVYLRNASEQHGTRQKSLENDERAAEVAERLRFAMAAAELGDWDWDADTDLMRLSPRAAEIFGISPQPDQTRTKLREMLHPEDRERARLGLTQASRHGGQYNIEYRVNRPDGTLVWVSANGRGRYDAQGQLIGMTGVVQDVTSRKNAEREAKEATLLAEASVGRWRAVVANMDEGVVLADPLGNLQDMNQAALRMHGYSSVEQMRKPLTEIAPEFEMRSPDGQVLALDQWPIPRLLRGETFTNLELRLSRPAQALDLIISHSGASIRNAQGDISLVLLTLHDVTEERRTQRFLRESDSQFREMFDQTPIGMTLNDLNGRYLHVNPAYCRIVGRTREELLNPTTDFRELIFPEDRPRMLTRQSQVLSGEIPAFFLEKRYVRPDGSLIWVRVTGTVRRDADGRAIQFVRLVEDIDDRKRGEQELAQLLESERAARAEAERAGRMKDEFLATLSHELRTPLNAILGWSQILAGSDRDDAEVTEGLRIIERNARAQTQIIEDLLDMSRIISGKVRLDVQRLDLASLVQSAVETVRPAAAAKEIRLQMVLDPMAGPISGDPNRLQQIFWNLLNNAVKFTPCGGRVQVLLERVNSHLEISVIDTGEGIRPEFLPHVFDRFRQSDASTTRRHGGLGLGLAIVKQLVELHGGVVRTKSPGTGQGSTFIVALPLTVFHSEAEPLPERRHPTVGGVAILLDSCAKIEGVKVLVVDDEPDARALIKRLLEDCNARVTVAGSVAEALNQVQAERPDVLVSDIGMPGEDGYTLIRRIRALGPQQGGDIPAVALTAYARSEDRMKAVMAGFQHHVAKPVEPAELIAMIASLAGRTRPSA